MKGSGGTDGGLWRFLLGMVLCLASLWFFFDSVRVTSGHFGLLSGMMHRGGGGGMMTTTSMGIIFVPFFIGVVALFYDAKMMWAWVLTWVGLAIIVVEIVSRLRFFYDMKTTSLLLMIVLFAAGTGLMIRSYRDMPEDEDDSDGDPKSVGSGKPTSTGVDEFAAEQERQR